MQPFCPCSRVLNWTSKGLTSKKKKFPHYVKPEGLIRLLHKSIHWSLPGDGFICHTIFFHIHFYIIFPSMPRSLKWYETLCVCISHVCHVSCMYPAHISLILLAEEYVVQSSVLGTCLYPQLCILLVFKNMEKDYITLHTLFYLSIIFNFLALFSNVRFFRSILYV